MNSCELALKPNVGSAREGRELVQRVLGGADQDYVETAMVLTDELVANAVTHGRPPITIAVSVDQRSIDVAVSDAGPGRPEIRAVPTVAENGRGLVIIDVLSDRWGVDSLPVGKRVWFRLETGPDGRTARAPTGQEGG